MCLILRLVLGTFHTPTNLAQLRVWELSVGPAGLGQVRIMGAFCSLRVLGSLKNKTKQISLGTPSYFPGTFGLSETSGMFRWLFYLVLYIPRVLNYIPLVCMWVDLKSLCLGDLRSAILVPLQVQFCLSIPWAMATSGPNLKFLILISKLI